MGVVVFRISIVNSYLVQNLTTEHQNFIEYYFGD
jgi:hypothetical protein